MTLPLTALECELLEAVLADREDAPAVLGDYWLAHGHEARGTLLQLEAGANRDRIDLADEEARLAPAVHAWRLPLVQAGFRERDLALADGFLQIPLAIPAGHPLDAHPDTVRLSPRYYRELGELAHGVEHVVYEAEAVTPRTRVRVVLKFARQDDFQRVLDREIAHLQRFAHPNLPRLLGHVIRPPAWGPRASCHGIVLAWAGRDLRSLLVAARAAGRALGVAFAVSVGVQLLDAIAAVGIAGIVHGEVRPDHVLLAADGTVTLIDFGYARTDVAPGPAYMTSPVPTDAGWRLRYLAPEQVRGVRLDERTDVFATAGLISQLVANEHSIPVAQNEFDMLLMIRDTPQLASPALPAALRAAVQRGLALQLQDRPRASEMRDALVAAAAGTRLEIGAHVIAQHLVALGVPA